MRNEELVAKLNWCEEQFRLFQKKKYGASSEKTNENQLSLSLFNKEEGTSDLKEEELELDPVIYIRKKMKKRENH